LSVLLAQQPAFDGCTLRPAGSDDEQFLFELHRAAMREYVEATWSWDEAWQRTHFAHRYVPDQNALILSDVGPAQKRAIGRVSLTLHWRRIFLRDIELVPDARNRGLGAAIIGAVLELARDADRRVDLMVLRCNPAQRLYMRLGFRITSDDGARLSMRFG
jgi:GNAT superfamily N-acetyltransferase